MIETDFHNEIVKLKIKTNDFEALLNTRFRVIGNGINELMKTILEKL